MRIHNIYASAAIGTDHLGTFGAAVVRVGYDGASACAVLYIYQISNIYTMVNLNWFHQMCYSMQIEIYSYDHGRKSNSNYIHLIFILGPRNLIY